MADVTSKNMYALLGNDPEEDSDREPEPPTKAKDKPVARTGKRDGPETAPGVATGGGDSRGGRGGRGGRGRGGSEGAFLDREAGSAANRSHQDYVNQTDRPYRGRGGDRGGRGRGGRDRGDRSGRGGRDYREYRDDRHSHGRPNEHVKQADQSWGAPTGGAEWDDEKAGEEIAKEDAKDGVDANVDAPVNADGEKLDDQAAAAEPEEPETKTKSWEEYLAEQAEKKLALGGTLEARKPNEGSKQDKKWTSAKPLSKDEEEEAYIKGREEKAARQRERKEKQTLEIDHRFQESTRGDRGGRGEHRGRGRGEYRGSDRGGDRGGRGEFRGGRGGGRGGEHRGEFRGGRGRGGEGRGGRGVNTSDESAFPKLGA